MSSFRNFLIFAVAVFFGACSEDRRKDEVQELRSIDTEVLKTLISEAAAIDRSAMKTIWEAEHVDTDRIMEKDGETLSCHTIIITLPVSNPDDRLFINFSIQMTPSMLSEALQGERRGQGFYSILHPEYINDLEWERNGESVEGSFSFKATNKAYDGEASFVARFTDGPNSDLYISAFVLNSEGIKLERRGPNSKWRRFPIEK